MEARLSDEELLAEVSWLQRLARAIVGNDAEAEDLCQETLLAALHSPSRPHTGIRAWLRGTLLQRRAMRARGDARRRQRESKVARPESQEIESWAETAEAFERVLAELRRLPHSMGEALLLRYYYGKSIEQIAAHQGVPSGTVRSRLQRALNQLRLRLRSQGDSFHALALAALTPAASPHSPWKTWIAVKTSTTASAAAVIAASLTLMVLFLPEQDLHAVTLGETATAPARFDSTASEAEFDAMEEAIWREELDRAPDSEATTLAPQTPDGHLPLQDVVSIHGKLMLTLLDSANGRTVESGRIRLLANDHFIDQAFWKSPLELEIPEGEYEILVHALGFEALRLQSVHVMAGELTPLGAHVMQRGTAQLTGSVTQGDRELEGVRVELHGAGRQPCSDHVEQDSLTPCPHCGYALDRSVQALDEEQSFAFDRLCSGDYLVVAYDEGGTVLGHQSVELSIGESQHLDFELAFLDLPIQLVDAHGNPFRGVWEEDGQYYTNPIHFLCSDQGVVCGRALWNPPGSIEVDGVTYYNENRHADDAHSLRMRLLGMTSGNIQDSTMPRKMSRELLLNPKLPSPLPRVKTERLVVESHGSDGFALLRTPSQVSRIDVSCGPFMAVAEIDWDNWDGEPFQIAMIERCGMSALLLEQNAVTCNDCHRMP